MIFHVEGVLIIGQISQIIRVGGISSAKLHIFFVTYKIYNVQLGFFLLNGSMKVA